MHTSSRWMAGLLVPISLLLVGAFAEKSAAQVCDYPLFVTQGSVEANVMFLFDNSGSMNEAIWDDNYNPAVTYTGGFCTTCMYYIGTSGNYSGNGKTAYLVKSDQGQSGRYIGNYLNWVFYNATDAQRAAIPTVTRVQVAKAAVSSIVNDNPGIRFGVTVFNYDNGGRIVSPVGTPRATLLGQVNSIGADSWTPIAEAMVTIAEEFGSSDSGAPIQYKCQKNFLVVVSDGFPTYDLNMPGYITDEDGDGNEPGNCASIGAPYAETNFCSDYMDDVAYYMLNTDLRDDLEGDQNVITYAVGFGIDAQLFQETADNGGGLYLNAENPAELNTSLENILRDIINRISSGSAVAVVSTEGESQDKLFRGKFMPSGWRGYLESFELPYEPGEAAAWEAGEILSDRDPSSRTIFSAINDNQYYFDDGYADDFKDPMGIGDVDSAAALINWVRGEDVDGYRSRDGWILGDIVDSSPMVVGSPSSFHNYDGYVAFRQYHENRTRVVYIGANDGMLHCFRESDGEELWAFIPPSQLGRLKDLAATDYCHEYFVNLTPKVVDVHINGSWRTVLIGGLKQGGDSYYALDVTYPESPSYLWETQLSQVIESWASPEVARVEGYGFLAFVGSGPDETNGEAHLVAIDVEDGAEIWSDKVSDIASMNMTSSATSVDLDFDGYNDLVYAGDLDGNLWRLDLRTDPWDLDKLFDGDQSIQAQPIVTVDYNDDVYIYFGTGTYIVPDDIDDTSDNTFFCVIDNHTGSEVDINDLVDQTDDIHELSSSDRGWYFHLEEASGERVVEPAALVSGNVYFTAFAPTDEACTAGGHSWLYSAKFRNGASAANEDEDVVDDRVEDLGEGVTTKPVIDIVNEKVIIQGSDTVIHVSDTKGVIRQLIVRSWRQIYQ